MVRNLNLNKQELKKIFVRRFVFWIRSYQELIKCKVIKYLFIHFDKMLGVLKVVQSCPENALNLMI